jgi:NADH-quinone oxidoreductase subunit J
MPALLFYAFAALTLVFGALVVMLRNPVASAMSLVVSFTGLATLFVSLDAYFIGTLQILVYAGAVMVLFLFIIMLLDIKAEVGRSGKIGPILAGVALAALFAVQSVVLISAFEQGGEALKNLPINLAEAVASGASRLKGTNEQLLTTLPDARLMGETLFDKYPFHLQVVGLLLLVGTIGVVVLSKRDKEANS